MYKRLIAVIVALILAGCATGPDTRPDIGIKGYTPGQTMATCPASTVESRELGEALFCVLPGQTIGDVGQAKALSLALHGGRLVMVTATIDRTPGARTLDYVRSMYTQKYGAGVTPYRTPFKHHWFVRRGVLTLDYADGTLTAYDRDLMSALPTRDTSNL